MERASTMACVASLSETTELQIAEADTDWGHEIQGGRSLERGHYNLIDGVGKNCINDSHPY